MYLPALIISFIIFTMLMSFVYFYMFARSQHRFIQFWGLCWAFYSLSLLFLILYINYDNLFLMEARKIFDMLNILFLLFGTYAFIQMEIPSYWYRFSLYLVIWVLIGSYYSFDLLSIYLPMSMYQVIVTTMLCYIIYKYWDVPDPEKYLSITIFILWGLGKATLSIIECEYIDVSSLYFIEIIFSNILNFFIFIIYIQKTRDEVAVTEQLFRLIAENATDIIFFYKLQPTPAFSYITPSVESVIGYTPQEFYSNPKFYFNIVPPSQFQDIADIFNAKEKAHSTNIFQFIHKNGTILWVEFKSSIIYEDLEPVAVEGMIRDVTRMKNAETELIASKQSRELLLSYVSHELKTPITSILGYVNALRDGTLKEAVEKEEAMDIIFAKSLTLERLIKDLFQLSKLETKQFSFSFMHMNAAELSKDLINQHILDIKTAGLKLNFKINYEELKDTYIIVDPERISQVFSNIIFNAIKYTVPNDKLGVKFNLDRKKENYTVTIYDSGVGISQKDLPYIFDRFFKASSNSQAKRESSTGLGLTISKEIIIAHKGTILAKSQLGKGSTFSFTIPIYRESNGKEFSIYA